jgi:hypothetical protein
MQSIDLGGFGIVGGHIVRQPTNCTVAFTAAGRGLTYTSPYTQRIWRNGALHAASSEAAKNCGHAPPGPDAITSRDDPPGEPPRVCRRLFCLSHAATAVSATLA